MGLLLVDADRMLTALLTVPTMGSRSQARPKERIAIPVVLHGGAVSLSPGLNVDSLASSRDCQMRDQMPRNLMYTIR